MRGADLLVQCLVQAGVTRIFSLSGNQIMPVFDACLTAGIQIIHTRHEAAAVYMAEAYAQLTGTLGVALVTAGTGAANAAGALFTASESETPVLLLSGDSPVSQDGMGAFQEMDQVSMMSAIAKLSVRPTNAAELGDAVARACQVAQSGRPGPVHIALAVDVLERPAQTDHVPSANQFMRDRLPATYADIDFIEQAIAQSQRPIFICGPTLNATRHPRITAWCAEIGVPVIAMESPRGLRDPSLGNLGTVLKQADLVVNLGKRVDFTVGFGKPQSIGEGTRWINIASVQHEQDRAQKNLGPSLVRAIMADPRDVVGALSAIDASKPDVSAWRDFVATELAQRSYPEVATDHITSQDLCQAVQDQIADHHDTAVICDGGEFGQWASAVTQAQSRIVNGISGAIGGGLCYGFAARLARPDALIFALMGDGSAGFHFAEFETAVRNNMHCVVVIGNDKRWNAEHLIQMRDYGPDRVFGCDLSDARYDLAAQALGAHGEYVTQLSELAPALRRAIDSKKPACVNVMIQGTPAPSGTSH